MSSVKEYINHLHSVYKNAVREDSPRVQDGIDRLKLPLHMHQQAVLQRMEQLEQSLNTGFKHRDELLFSNYAILGDGVGVGKSLMVLGHIARLSPTAALTKDTTIRPCFSPRMFSIKITPQPPHNNTCLIIVPHTLYRQWADYIKKQTTLKGLYLSRQAQMDEENFVTDLRQSDVVLVSNTLCKGIFPICSANQFRFQRIFVDEADTIHLPGVPDLESYTPFVWLITASWMNLMYMNATLYLDKSYVASTILAESSAYPHLRTHFLSRSDPGQHYYIEGIRVRALNTLRSLVSTSHPFRSQLVISCSEAFIKQSISLPPLIRRIILCRAPITHEILRNVVSASIQSRLHAGDTTGVLTELGIEGKDMKSLIEGVTETIRKELEKNMKIYAFKESLEYSSAATKAAALSTLQQRIDHNKSSIASIEERIQNFEKEVCPICYEEPEEFLVTPCCTHLFCPKCLLLSVSNNPQCPLCRADIHPSKCKKLVAAAAGPTENAIVTEETAAVQEPKKHEALLQLIQENPDGRFLIFSRYDNPFDQIEGSIAALGIKVRNLKGNKDVIAHTLKAFASGDVKCLLLNSQFAGSGLNITAATHVVLLHAMSYEEEKQILGRAYRVGREGPLNFIKLLHKGEETYSEPAA
jgi:SNF2 family DNA or RNA helicase